MCLSEVTQSSTFRVIVPPADAAAARVIGGAPWLYFLFFGLPLANSAFRSTAVFPAFYAGVLSLLLLLSLRAWCHVKAGWSKSDLQPRSLDFFINLGDAAVGDVVTSKEFEKL